MIGLLVSFTGVIVAGLAGVLGVWMERDKESSLMWAGFFSAIILFATGVELVHTSWQSYVDGATDEKMAFMLERLSDLSAGNPELEQFVAAELAVQARANPEMVKRLENNVAAKGGDPDKVRRMAAEGRRTSAGLGKTPGERPRARTQPAPKGDKAGAASAAPAPAAAAPVSAAPSPEVLAAAASGDPDAALKAAQAQADAMLASAAADADKMKAEAAALQAKADKTMSEAKKLKKDAEKLMEQAKGLGGIGGGGGGGKGGGGGGSKPKIPGL